MRYVLLYIVFIFISCSNGKLNEYNLETKENIIKHENDSVFLKRIIIQTH